MTGRALETKTLKIGKDLHRWLKVEAAKQGRDLQDVATEAIHYYREHHERSELITGRGATKVVAASDSLNPGNAADYTCDGIADDVEIQAALDSVDSHDVAANYGRQSILYPEDMAPDLADTEKESK